MNYSTTARTIEAQQRTLAEGFATAVKSQDIALMKSVTCGTASWSLPGNNLISGDAQGADAMPRRGQLLAEYGVNIQVEYMAYGQRGFGFLLHNTGSRLGRVLDEHLTSVFQTTDGLISQVDTYISDVEMLDRYFAP